ncbi:MAG: hypothetical protein KBT12_07930 [Bacteroidales bacterium]|nr:hypothetical protein [Candidatus Physcousia equi]
MPKVFRNFVAMENKTEHVAFFVSDDIDHAGEAMKWLAGQLAVRDVRVHVFIRTGRNEYGTVVHRRTVSKLAEMRQYFVQTQHTFQAVGTVGSMEFIEVPHTYTDERCLELLRKRIRQGGEDKPEIILPHKGICRSPWTLEGERIV